MLKKTWKILRSVPLQNLRLFTARFDYLINPRNGKEVEIVVLSGGHAVNITALTPDNEVVMIHQYRYGIHDYTTEIPGGLIDAGEEPLTAARRELREETGFSGDDWVYLGKIPQNPVFQDSFVHHFLLKNAVMTDSTEFDEAEDIELLKLPLAEVKAGLFAGRFQHPHTVSALALALRELQEI